MLEVDSPARDGSCNRVFWDHLVGMRGFKAHWNLYEVFCLIRYLSD